MEDIEAPFRTAMYVYELRKLLRYIRNAVASQKVPYFTFVSYPPRILYYPCWAGPGNEASSCVYMLS